MNVSVFYCGQTIVLTAAIADADGAFDPDGGVVVSVLAPDGTAVVDQAAMTKTAVGAYTYDYHSAADAAHGLYEWRVKAVDGTRTTITGATFKLVA